MKFKSSLLFWFCVAIFLFACDSGSGSGGDGNSTGGGSSTSAHAALPSNQNAEAIQDMYNKWINKFYVTYETDLENGVFTSTNFAPNTPGTARIKANYDGFTDGSRTCSEAIGYGMILTALMGDWEKYDKLLAYSKIWRYSIDGNQTALMRWSVRNFVKADGGSATDADIDILASLVIAYKKTENQNYLDEALAIGASIYDYEIDASTRLVLPAPSGDPLFKNGIPFYNISYISLPALKMMKDYDKSGRDWATVLEKNLSYMEMVQNNGDGLWPDWSDATGAPANPNNGSVSNLTPSDGSATVPSYMAYNKEAPRIPWRIAWYYHWYGDQRAKAMLDKGMAFLQSKGVSTYQDVKGFYSYTGGKESTGAGGPRDWASHCALGTGSSANQDWLNSCNERMIGFYVPSVSDYYSNSLQLIYAMFFNGKFN